MKFWKFWEKKVEIDEIQKEKDYLERVKGLNKLRAEVYEATEDIIRKRYKISQQSSKKGKDYIDDDPTILGGKHK